MSDFLKKFIHILSGRYIDTKMETDTQTDKEKEELEVDMESTAGVRRRGRIK
jgi:hypothetical protein